MIEMTGAEQEMFVQVMALRIAQRSTMAGVLFALAEAKAVDLQRALAFVDTLAAALRQPVGVTDPTTIRTLALAAAEMAELRPAMVTMATLPEGAGRA